jgi:two-component system cell cycle sensor histidine kinase/response regulator CckA
MEPRILVVDDEEAVRRFIDRALKEFGYAVTLCSNGTEALERAAYAQPFELLLTDVMMPEMRGDELAAEMLKRQPWLKVIYITGFPERLEETHPKLADYERVIEKPVTLAQLHDAVSLSLYGHRGGPAKA